MAASNRQWPPEMWDYSDLDSWSDVYPLMTDALLLQSEPSLFYVYLSAERDPFDMAALQLHSLFHILQKSPCRRKDETRWACRIHTCRKMQTDRDREARCNSLGMKGWNCMMFLFFPSHVLYIHVHRGRILFKRVVLCFSPMLWMDGWRTEPNVSTWVAEETSWQTGKREQAGNNGLFHSFQGCIQCYSLRGPNIKTWYCMSLFSALSQVGFCFATRWSSFSTLLRGFVY